MGGNAKGVCGDEGKGLSVGVMRIWDRIWLSILVTNYSEICQVGRLFMRCQ